MSRAAEVLRTAMPGAKADGIVRYAEISAPWLWCGVRKPTQVRRELYQLSQPRVKQGSRDKMLFVTRRELTIIGKDR
jgi:hypothetical protein